MVGPPAGTRLKARNQSDDNELAAMIVRTVASASCPGESVLQLSIHFFFLPHLLICSPSLGKGGINILCRTAQLVINHCQHFEQPWVSASTSIHIKKRLSD